MSKSLVPVVRTKNEIFYLVPYLLPEFWNQFLNRISCFSQIKFYAVRRNMTILFDVRAGVDLYGIPSKAPPVKSPPRQKPTFECKLRQKPPSTKAHPVKSPPRQKPTFNKCRQKLPSDKSKQRTTPLRSMVTDFCSDSALPHTRAPLLDRW